MRQGNLLIQPPSLPSDKYQHKYHGYRQKIVVHDHAQLISAPRSVCDDVHLSDDPAQHEGVCCSEHVVHHLPCIAVCIECQVSCSTAQGRGQHEEQRRPHTHAVALVEKVQVAENHQEVGQVLEYSYHGHTQATQGIEAGLQAPNQYGSSTTAAAKGVRCRKQVTCCPARGYCCRCVIIRKRLACMLFLCSAAVPVTDTDAGESGKERGCRCGR